jgi:predicted dinucleotide-utilizing enzyme
MTKQILISILLAFSSSCWGTLADTYEEDHLKASLEIYLTQNSIGGLDAIQAELAQTHAQLKITTKSGEELNLEQAKQKLAYSGVSMTATFPNGRIKVITIGPASGEVVNAIKKTYEGLGASVSTPTAR